MSHGWRQQDAYNNRKQKSHRVEVVYLYNTNYLKLHISTTSDLTLRGAFCSLTDSHCQALNDKFTIFTIQLFLINISVSIYPPLKRKTLLKSSQNNLFKGGGGG